MPDTLFDIDPKSTKEFVEGVDKDKISSTKIKVGQWSKCLGTFKSKTGGFYELSHMQQTPKNKKDASEPGIIKLKLHVGAVTLWETSREMDAQDPKKTLMEEIDEMKSAYGDKKEEKKDENA